MENKKEIIENFKVHDTDTGSSSVQIAVLTERINTLIDHLKAHKKDHHSRRGLLILVGRRKKFMKYLGKRNPEELKKIADKLKLKIK